MDKLPYKEPLPSNSTIVRCTKELISRTWGLSQPISNYNPSPNPISLERKHMQLLKNRVQDYVVAEKSDGVRYLLILGRDRFNQHTPFSVMVNRRLQIYQIPVDAKPEYYEGSVFDGELVIETVTHMNHTRQIFLVFDAYLTKNSSLIHNPFLDRYKECNRVFNLNGKDILDDDIKKWESIAREEAKADKIVCLGNHKAMMFRPKPAVDLVNLGSLWRSISRLLHPSDGLILTPKPTKVLSGTHDTMFKWKQNHTIDLLVDAFYKRGGWNYRLSFMDKADIKDCAHNPFDVMKKSVTLIAVPNSMLTNTSRYFGDKNKSSYKLLGEFKCVIENNRGLCKLQRWRKDKSTPNNSFIIQRTLVNIKEDINIDELLELTSLQAYGFNKD